MVNAFISQRSIVLWYVDVYVYVRRHFVYIEFRIRNIRCLFSHLKKQILLLVQLLSSVQSITSASNDFDKHLQSNFVFQRKKILSLTSITLNIQIVTLPELKERLGKWVIWRWTHLGYRVEVETGVNLSNPTPKSNLSGWCIPFWIIEANFMARNSIRVIINGIRLQMNVRRTGGFGLLIWEGCPPSLVVMIHRKIEKYSLCSPRL